MSTASSLMLICEGSVNFYKGDYLCVLFVGGDVKLGPQAYRSITCRIVYEFIRKYGTLGNDE